MQFNRYYKHDHLKFHFNIQQVSFDDLKNAPPQFEE